jgi:hypothetical protein
VMSRWKQQVEGQLQPSETGISKQRTFLGDFRGNMVMMTSWFGTSTFQNCKRMNFCFLKPPNLWHFVLATPGKWTQSWKCNLFPLFGKGKIAQFLPLDTALFFYLALIIIATEHINFHLLSLPPLECKPHEDRDFVLVKDYLCCLEWCLACNRCLVNNC